MIYRIAYYDDSDGSSGYAYTTSARDANRLLKDWQKDAPDTRQSADIEAAATPRTRKDVVRLLERWGSHADNG